MWSGLVRQQLVFKSKTMYVTLKDYLSIRKYKPLPEFPFQRGLKLEMRRENRELLTWHLFDFEPASDRLCGRVEVLKKIQLSPERTDS